MNAGPACPRCGATITNPNATACIYCQQPLASQAPQGYGAPPQGYGAPPPQGYGAPPQGYGAPPQGYGAPMQGPGFYPQQRIQASSGWGGFWQAMSILQWIRIGIAVVVLSMIALGACINAIAN